MRCVDFERRLQRRLDERTRPEADESLQLHASQCSRCLELMEGQKLLFDRLHEALPVMSADFSRRAVARATITRAADLSSAVQPTTVKVDLPARPKSRRYWPLAAAVSAAAAVVIFALWPAIAHRFANRIAVHQIAQRHQVADQQRLPQSPVEQKPGEKGAHRPTRIGPGTIAVTRRPPFVPNTPPAVPTSPSVETQEYRQIVRGIIAKLPDMPDSRMESIDHIAGGFRPLATTLEAAWDTIRRTIPVGREPSASEPQASFPAWYGEHPVA